MKLHERSAVDVWMVTMAPSEEKVEISINFLKSQTERVGVCSDNCSFRIGPRPPAWPYFMNNFLS